MALRRSMPCTKHIHPLNHTIVLISVLLTSRILILLPTVYSIIEINWFPEGDCFPEAQACASAAMFYGADSCLHPWIPICVLTRSSYKIGGAFMAFGGRWAFSEIFEKSNLLPFTPVNDKDVLQLLHCSDFLVQSAVFHRSCAMPDMQTLVDSRGRTFLLKYEIIGDRVLMGIRSAVGSFTIQKKVAKFFANREAASDAMARQSAICPCIGAGTPVEPGAHSRL